MFKKKTFTGGFILKGGGLPTDAPPVESISSPLTVTIPLLQHSGSPAHPVVRAGDHVSIGQMIGQARDCDAASVHASISGTVRHLIRYPYTPNRAVFSVVIENDGKEEFASPIPFDAPWMEIDESELIRLIALSGSIDYNGGNGVPTHSKLAAARERPPAILIVNALWTEPPVSSGFRLLLEQAERVLTGILICKKIIAASRCIIAINDNCPEIERSLSDSISDERFKEVSLVALKPKYPLEREQLLIKACTGMEYAASVPYTEREALVLAAETAACVRDAIVECRPWYQRIVTIAGDAVGKPKNYLVPIGSPARFLLQACGANLTKTKKVVFGGPLSGTAIQDLNDPVLKSTRCILTVDRCRETTHGAACIGCGRCVSVCPMRLAPSRLAAAARSHDTAETAAWGIMECIECGCCAYSCPAARNLVHDIAYGKLQCRRRESNAAIRHEAVV